MVKVFKRAIYLMIIDLNRKEFGVFYGKED